jgi:hypothetical protein
VSDGEINQSVITHKWRIKTKEELETLIKKENIVRFIKSQRLRWAAHVIRMDTTRTS